MIHFIIYKILYTDIYIQTVVKVPSFWIRILFFQNDF